MTPEVVQTLIDQAPLRNSGGEDGSHSSHVENPRNMHTTRPCYYADFMKCHPLNFKGTEGAVGLTRWIKKIKSDSKRKADDISRNNQQPFKKQNVAKAYNLGSAEKKTYKGNAPKYTKCQHNHPGPCTLKCHKCGKIGHYARDCRSTGNTNATNNRGGNRPNSRRNGCFGCGNPRHFKRDCPKLKNKDGGNRNPQG
nr:hypothetical protein [Tanacetum cinerariifolium]